MAKTPKKSAAPASVRKSPRASKAGTHLKSGSPGCSKEDTVFSARDLANMKFKEKFAEYNSLVTEVWGSKEPTRYGYKDELVKLEDQAEFFKWYEFAFGRKDVQNHYVPLYFARAFALYLKGESVDWDDVKKTATAKSKVKESEVLTEVVTVKSSNAKGHKSYDTFYKKEDLDSLNVFLESRSSLKESICKEMQNLQETRLQLYETLKHREGERAVYSKLVHEAETNYLNLMSELEAFQQQMDGSDGSAMKFEHIKWKVEDAIAQKSKRGQDLAELSKEVEAKASELRQLDSELNLRSSKKRAIEEGDTKILELREFLDHSSVLSLQPPPLSLVSVAEQPNADFQSYTNCEQCFGSSPVVLASCRHPYCLLCISYLASTRNNCAVPGCTWDVNLPRALGLIGKGDMGSIKKPEKDAGKNRVDPPAKTLDFSSCVDDYYGGKHDKSTPSTSRSPLNTFNTFVAEHERGGKGTSNTVVTRKATIVASYAQQIELLKQRAECGNTVLEPASEENNEAVSDTLKKKDIIVEVFNTPKKTVADNVQKVPILKPMPHHQTKLEMLFSSETEETSGSMALVGTTIEKIEESCKTGTYTTGTEEILVENVATDMKQVVVVKQEKEESEDRTDTDSGVNEKESRKRKDTKVSRPAKRTRSQTSVEQLDMDNLQTMVPFYPFQAEPLIKVTKYCVETLFKDRHMSNRHLDIFGRYVSSTLTSKWRDVFFFFPSENFLTYRAAFKRLALDANSMGQPGRSAVEKGLQGIVVSKCQYIMVPVQVEDPAHHVLVIFVLESAKNCSTTSMASPAIIVLNSMTGITVDNKLLNMLHKDVITYLTNSSSRRVELYVKNAVKKETIPEVPQQTDNVSCGLYVMAFMQAFVDAQVNSKSMFSSTWFDKDFALGRRNVLIKAMIEYGLRRRDETKQVVTGPGQKSGS